MKLTVVAGTLLAGMAMTTTAFAGSQGNTCTARVLHSEELPFAPFGSWLVKVTLEVTPPDGNAYAVSYTHLDVYKRQASIRLPGMISSTIPVPAT